MRGEQVVGGIVVMSGVADEGGEQQFRVELASAIEGLHAGGAVMVFGLSQEEEDREIKGRRGGCQLIKGVAVNKAIVIAIPAPRGKAVGIEPSAVATIDASLAAIAKFAARRAGAGFEFRAVPGQINRLGRGQQTQSVRAQDDGFEHEIKSQRGESRPGLVKVFESFCDQALDNAWTRAAVFVRSFGFEDRLANDRVGGFRKKASAEIIESADARSAVFKAGESSKQRLGA